MPEKLSWTPALVNRFWDAVAESRLGELSFGKLAGPYVLMAAKRYLRRGGRHLDFGAGDGHFARHLVNDGFPTAAFEPSPSRQAAIAENIRNSTGFLGCIGPDYEGPPFDVIFMLEVIEHILEEALPAVFKLLDRLLAHDGLLIITVPNREDLDLAAAVDPRDKVVFHRWQHVRSVSAESLTEVLSRFGFGPIISNEIEFSDVVFGPGGGRLASRPELVNLFNSYRQLLIGNRERLFVVAARSEIAAQRSAEIKAADAWSQAPVILTARTELGFTGMPSLARTENSAPALPATDAALWITIDPEHLEHGTGYCWRAKLPDDMVSDAPNHETASTIELFEDHLPIGPRHSLHDRIRQLGEGRYSHWNGFLYFSSSDGTDPRHNGRTYLARINQAANDGTGSLVVPLNWLKPTSASPYYPPQGSPAATLKAALAKLSEQLDRERERADEAATLSDNLRAERDLALADLNRLQTSLDALAQADQARRARGLLRQTLAAWRAE
jgi:SAM-dependent methyltransferase